MQKMKGKIKVAASAAAGALMIGATMAGAMAADLGNLPDPFVSDNEFVGQIVVGQDAIVPDVIAAAQVSAAFGEYLVSASATGGEASITGGLQEEVNLGETIAGSNGFNLAKFKDNKISYLKDTQITYESDEYDVHEEIIIGDTNLKVITGTDGTSGMYDADEYGSDVASKVYMAFQEGDIRYSYVFDDDLNITNLDDNLKIELLGREIEISDGTIDDSITVTSASDYNLAAGESTTVDGHTVTVSGISETKAYIKVEGPDCATAETDYIAEGETFDSCGPQVKVESDGVWFVEAGDPGNSVKLQIGEEITEVYDHLDPFIGFEDADDTDVEWKWNISVDSDGYVEYIGAYNYQDHDSVDDGAYEVGEGFNLWNDYATLKIASLTDVSYGDFTAKFDEIDIYATAGATDKYIDGGDNTVSLVITGPEDDTFSAEYKKVAAHANSTGVYVAHYDADESKWVRDALNETAGFDVNTTWDTGIDGEYGETGIDLILEDTATGAGLNLAAKLTIGTDDLVLDVTDDTDGLSAASDDSGTEDAEAGDVNIDSTDIGSKETDVRSGYGIIVTTPDSNSENDEVEFSVPDEQVKANVYIGSTDGGTSVSDAEVTYDYTGLNSEVAVLDSEADTTGSTPLIVVGGPYANTLAKSLIGEDDATIKDYFGYDADAGTGKGVVELFDASETEWGVEAMVVAGWEAKDTRAAAYRMGQYLTGAKDLSDLSGKETLKVTATSATSITEETTE